MIETRKNEAWHMIKSQKTIKATVVIIVDLMSNHILSDFMCSFPYRKECNYFQIALLLSQ